MVDPLFDPTAASSMAEAVAERTGALTFVPTAHLPMWLPDLAVPHAWCPVAIDDATTTRMLTRQLRVGRQWDGCEVLNLYRVPGTVPETVVLANADRTLRDCGARDIQTMRVDTPPRSGVIATRASGTLHVGTRSVLVRYNYFTVNSTAGAALIEQVILVAAEAYPALTAETEALTAMLQRSLLASIDRVADSPISRDVRRPIPAPAPELSGLTVTEQGER